MTSNYRKTFDSIIIPGHYLLMLLPALAAWTFLDIGTTGYVFATTLFTMAIALAMFANGRFPDYIRSTTARRAITIPTILIWIVQGLTIALALKERNTILYSIWLASIPTLCVCSFLTTTYLISNYRPLIPNEYSITPFEWFDIGLPAQVLFITPIVCLASIILNGANLPLLLLSAATLAFCCICTSVIGRCFAHNEVSVNKLKRCNKFLIIYLALLSMTSVFFTESTVLAKVYIIVYFIILMSMYGSVTKYLTIAPTHRK